MKPLSLPLQPAALLAGVLLLALAPALSAQTASTYVTSGIEKAHTLDFDGAIADYNKALELNSSFVSAYYNRGLARNGQGNFDGAIADYDQVLKLKAGFTDAVFHRGISEFLQGNFEAAINDFTKTAEQKPESQPVYFHRALAREAEGNLEGAYNDYTKALTMKSADEESAQYLLLYSALLGRRMHHPPEDRLKAAIAWSNEWTRALASFLSDQMAETELFKLAAATGDDQKDIQQAEAFYFAGVIRLIAGDKAVAKEDFQKSFDASGPALIVHRMARVELDRN